jgi:regulatory protein
LLSRREHTAAELSDKLRRRGIPSTEITDVIERLTETGIIDNERAARIIIRGELRKRPVGRMRLLSKLSQRRVPSAVIRRCFDEMDESWEHEQCIRAIDSWFRKNTRSGRWKDALARHLRSRGFVWECIRDTLGSAKTGEGMDAENIEDDDK